jgi:hypothetical protein
MTDWRFDNEDPASECFEEDVLRFLPAVKPALERALVDIQDDPLSNERELVRGEVIYIKRLDASLTDNEIVPALLLGYTVSQRQKLIRKLLLCRVAEVTPNGTDTKDKEIYEALRRVLDIALARAKNRRDH